MALLSGFVAKSREPRLEGTAVTEFASNIYYIERSKVPSNIQRM